MHSPLAPATPLLRIDRTWSWALGLLAVVIAGSELTSIDLALQDRFFDFATGRWWIDATAPLPRLLFYTGPKFLIIALGVGLLALAIGPASWRRGRERRGFLVALVTLASVPALVGLGKQITNTFCPSEVRRYGGDVPYVKLCESYPDSDRPTRRGGCFPAGHASGGFALFGLVGLARTRRGQQAALALALTVGGAMGGYQMLKGAHYLSHTLVTMLLAWCLLIGWRKLLRAGG